MKQASIILALILSCNLSYSQNYFPFPIENACWNVYLESTCDNDSPPDTILLSYVVKGDTLINNLSYSLLHLEKGNPENPVIETVGFYREDNKRIYFSGGNPIYKFYGEEIVLYDFNTTVGDTIFHDSSGIFKTVVLEIDSMLIDGEYRKRYKVDNSWFYHNPDYLVEGIGSIKRLLATWRWGDEYNSLQIF